MLPYIDDQLTRWEVWLRSDKIRLGYPRQSAFVRAMASKGDLPPLPDEEALLMCAAIRALDPTLRVTVETYYHTMKHSTVAGIARQLGCSRQTVHDRISRAHVCILGLLNDLAAGLPVAPYPDTLHMTGNLHAQTQTPAHTKAVAPDLPDDPADPTQGAAERRRCLPHLALGNS